MADQVPVEWLSLQQASALLGVHPATLRAWSDRGHIASRRTPGGHRRLSRADLEAWLESQRRREPGAELFVQNALGRMRLEMTRSEEDAPAWLARLEVEHDNLRTALAWCRTSHAVETESRLAEALIWFWYLSGYLTEGRARLEQAHQEGDDKKQAVSHTMKRYCRQQNHQRRRARQYSA